MDEKLLNLIVAYALLFLASFLIMTCWGMVAHLFGLPTIGYFQTVAIVLIVDILSSYIRGAKIK